MRSFSLFCVAILIFSLAAQPLSAQGGTAGDVVPAFKLDATWPKPLPNSWTLGPISGVSVDSNDHVWMLHRPGNPRNGPKAKPGSPMAPPLIEFDSDGNFLRGFGGPAQGWNWPIQEHGLRVDYSGNVWITGNVSGDFGTVLKLSSEGRLLLQIGKQGDQGHKPRNNDQLYLGRLPADMSVDANTSELFLADGERGSRRLIVFDSNTGAFKRMWGAYGGEPDENLPSEIDPSGPDPKTFSNAVHCVVIARDGLVYVCDRGYNRIQVFQKNGTFVREVFIEKSTKAPGSTASIALSPDQKYLYIGDGVNQKVWILERESLAVLGSFPVMHNLHTIAIDSKGNLYAAEVAGEHLEKFTISRP